jgi:hypothetical protein
MNEKILIAMVASPAGCVTIDDARLQRRKTVISH